MWRQRRVRGLRDTHWLKGRASHMRTVMWNTLALFSRAVVLKVLSLGDQLQHYLKVE